MPFNNTLELAKENRSPYTPRWYSHAQASDGAAQEALERTVNHHAQGR